MAKDHRLDISLDIRGFVLFIIAAMKQTVKTFIALFKAIVRQFRQMYDGVTDYASRAEIESFVPEWFLKLTVRAIPNALWGKTPSQQIHGSIILMGWGFFTSAFTGFATLIFVWFWSIFFWIGVLRYSDWGSAVWSRTTSASMSLPGRGSDGSYRTRSK